MNSRSHFRFTALLASLALVALPAQGAELRLKPKAVLELFTSQGCASCPPADALLAELGERDDIVALTYHVDYWDYVGWADTFASPDHSKRQRAYAESRGSNRLYTPQLIVNGTTDVVGSRRRDVIKAVGNARLHLPITLAVNEDTLAVDIAGQAGLDEAVVWLVTYQDKADVTIERGENEGKVLSYTQIVTGRQLMGMWEPGTGAHLKLPLHEVLSDGSDGVAIIVQHERQGRPGPILGAASFQL